MKKSFFLLAVLATLAFQSCKKVNGDGPVITETRTVNSFKGIYTTIDADVHYSVSSRYTVEVRAQQNILDIIETRVSGNDLKIQYTGTYNIGHHDRIDIYITSPEANSLTVTGSGNLYATGTLNVDDMNMRVTGSGEINIDNLVADHISGTITGSGDINVSNGSADTEDFEISGSGSIDCLNVKADDVKTQTFGSGDTRVYASNKLDVTIAGSGDVIYKGNPSISKSITGSGRVNRW